MYSNKILIDNFFVTSINLLTQTQSVFYATSTILPLEIPYDSNCPTRSTLLTRTLHFPSFFILQRILYYREQIFITSTDFQASTCTLHMVLSI